MMITPQKAAQRFRIRMELRSLSTKNSIAIFIKKEKIPKDNMMKGKERSLTIGRMRELTIPKTAPAMIRSFQFPRKTNPEISFPAKSIAKELARTWDNIFQKKLIQDY
jgi:hypothetical protein